MPVRIRVECDLSFFTYFCRGEILFVNIAQRPKLCSMSATVAKRDWRRKGLQELPDRCPDIKNILLTGVPERKAVS